jgi:predicted DNA binding CopG/RHH family protein
MKKKIAYTDEPMKVGRRVDDFLPRPEDLVFHYPSQKVTIALSTNTLAFFKTQAKKHKTPYQKMIRNLLDAYVAHISPQL